MVCASVPPAAACRPTAIAQGASLFHGSRVSCRAWSAGRCRGEGSHARAGRERCCAVRLRASRAASWHDATHLALPDQAGCLVVVAHTHNAQAHCPQEHSRQLPQLACATLLCCPTVGRAGVRSRVVGAGASAGVNAGCEVAQRDAQACTACARVQRGSRAHAGGQWGQGAACGRASGCGRQCGAAASSIGNANGQAACTQITRPPHMPGAGTRRAT